MAAPSVIVKAATGAREMAASVVVVERYVAAIYRTGNLYMARLGIIVDGTYVSVPRGKPCCCGCYQRPSVWMHIVPLDVNVELRRLRGFSRRSPRTPG